VRVLIADDEPVAREVLREHASSIPGLDVVGEAATGAETMQRILELHPDLVLLDLQMPELDGLAVVRALQGKRMPLIVFVTAYEQHALEAFEVGATDYLLKPVRRERLEKAVERAREKAARSGTPAETMRKIIARRGEDLYPLDPAEVIAFHAEGALVHVVTATQRYLCDLPLRALEPKLDPERFKRVHRGTIINTDHIRRISPLSSKRWLLKMSNGFEAVVSKRLASAIRESARW
jgi:two-component system LytT family response regulator